jgi:hypothetical protein
MLYGLNLLGDIDFKPTSYYITKLSRVLQGYEVDYTELYSSGIYGYSRTQYYRLLYSLIEWSLNYQRGSVYIVTSTDLDRNLSHCSVIKNGEFFDPNNNAVISGHREILQYYNTEEMYREDIVRNISYKLIYPKVSSDVSIVKKEDVLRDQDIFDDFYYMSEDERQFYIQDLSIFGNTEQYYNNLFNTTEPTLLQKLIKKEEYNNVILEDIDNTTLCDCMMLYINYEQIDKRETANIKQYPETSIENIARNMIKPKNDESTNYLIFSDEL